MDKELDHKHEKNYFLFLLNKHKTKIILFISIIILGIFLIIFLNILNEKKNSEISEQFLKAGILLSSNEKDESKKILEKIVLSKNKFYSKLALNILIEKNLIKEEKKVLNLFEIVEKVDVEPLAPLPAGPLAAEPPPPTVIGYEPAVNVKPVPASSGLSV